jgi:superfamily II DNA/RNA helicase
MRSCDGCHLLAAILDELGLGCVALHSHKSQKRRLAALHTFKAGELASGPALKAML